MHSVIILLSFVSQVHTQDVLAKHSLDAQDFTDKLDDKLVYKMFDRVLKLWPLNCKDLDSTTLAKSGCLKAKAILPTLEMPLASFLS